MRNFYLFCICLLSFSAIKGQKTSQLDQLNGLDKFVLGGDIANYANNITKALSKDSVKGLFHYRYTGKDIKTFQGVEVQSVSLEFCSGKLEKVGYNFGAKDWISRKVFTKEDFNKLKKKLDQQYGDTRIGNNIKRPEAKGKLGVNSEIWSWTNKKMMMNLMWLKISSTNENFVTLSVVDNELRENCKNK